jgi:uncharacterized protein YjbI with pentapeptide repeats
MGAKLRSWWWQIKRYRVNILIVAIILVVAIALIILGYQFDWTGFGGYNKVTTTTVITSSPPKITRTEEYQPGKGLWDWLQLLGILAIPVVVGLGTVWFTTQQSQASEANRAQQAKESEANREKRHQTDLEIADKNRELQQQTDLQIAANNQQAAALQTYLDQMSELVLNKRLGVLRPEDEDVRKIARTRTLIILQLLGPGLKGSILQFLYEAGLISGDKDKVVIQLQGADLNGARLTRIFLNGVNISRVDLNEAILYRAILTNAILELADLRGANIREADLIRCDLRNADLTEADLSGAILIGANIYGAKVTTEQLDKAKSLKGATMPDGSIHP